MVPSTPKGTSCALCGSASPAIERRIDRRPFAVFRHGIRTPFSGVIGIQSGPRDKGPQLALRAQAMPLAIEARNGAATLPVSAKFVLCALLNIRQCRLGVGFDYHRPIPGVSR
jgi:hypothetical protein